MEGIAQQGEARFLWWIQKTFHVLATDTRFLDLTEEQLELMYQHYLLDNPQTSNTKEDTGGTHDPDYLEPDKRYHDPDFDEEWDNIDNHDTKIEPDVNNPEEWEEV